MVYTVYSIYNIYNGYIVYIYIIPDIGTNNNFCYNFRLRLQQVND